MRWVGVGELNQKYRLFSRYDDGVRLGRGEWCGCTGTRYRLLTRYDDGVRLDRGEAGGCG